MLDTPNRLDAPPRPAPASRETPQVASAAGKAIGSADRAAKGRAGRREAAARETPSPAPPPTAAKIAAGGKSVSQTHKTKLDDVLAPARELWVDYEFHSERSHKALYRFLGGVALALRKIDRDPGPFEAECKRAHIKAKLRETRLVRLIIGGRIEGDPSWRWAACAAYVANPPNDPPPPTVEAAADYIGRRGFRNLADLQSKRWRPPDPYWSPAYFALGDGNVEYYTPPAFFKAMGIKFDLDVASPGADKVPWIPARHHYTAEDDGLVKPWFGTVWCNCPYGRDSMWRWAEKFVEHGNGVMLCPASTATRWFQGVAKQAAILFLNKKLRFRSPTGEVRRQFPIGTALVAMGDAAIKGLIRAANKGLGTLMIPAPESWKAERAKRTALGSSPRGDARKLPGLEGFAGKSPEKEGARHYWITPHSLTTKLKAEFGDFTFDPCPHPRPDGFDGLVADWGGMGSRVWVNPIFTGSIMAWVRKSLAERAKGALVVMILPTYQDRALSMLEQAGAELRFAGRPRWLAIEDGSPSPKPFDHPLCMLAILRPL